MIRSMTGFGKAAARNDQMVVTVEIKTVNHRYCDVTVKCPRSFIAFENEIKKRIGEGLGRGKVDVYVNLDLVGSAALSASLNRPLVEAYLSAISQLKSDYPVAGEISLDWLASQKDLIRIEESAISQEEIGQVTLEAVDGALEGLNQMRLAEGQALVADFSLRLKNLSQLINQVETLAAEVPKEWRQKLESRLQKLAADVEFDPQRLAQELAIVADRCDVSEELTRFRSHLQQFELLFQSEEPVGRKMDFLVQELNREANTTGSKSNHADLTRLVVDIKAELEKIREQVQNVE